jgi:hypothetical protein
MRASGWVRDLREAMSLGTAEAAALQSKLAEFAAGTTREAQMAVVDALKLDASPKNRPSLKTRTRATHAIGFTRLPCQF